MKNLYDILEISPAAGDEVIKAAYRALSNTYHPDKNTGVDAATQAMAAINRAYAILSDPVKRKAYDASLAADYTNTAVDGFPPKTPETYAGVEATTTTAVESPVAVTASSDVRLSRNAAIATVAVVVAVGAIFVLNNSGSDYTSDSVTREADDLYWYRLRDAEALFSGDGVPQNFREAKAAFEAIADAKDLRNSDPKNYRGRASQRIAEIYYNGLGVPKDTVKAEEWFRRAAQSGVTVGPGPALTLGKFFEEGIGGKQDIVEAYRWYNVAAGTPFEQGTVINLNKYTVLIDLAKKKKAELATRLTTEQLNRAQQSPFPPHEFLR